MTTHHTVLCRLRPAVALGALAVLLAACSTPPPPSNQGRAGGRVDPTTDAWSESGGTQLRSQDLVEATDTMAMSIAQRLDVTNRESPPRIVVGELVNRTSNPERNYQIFLTRLRALLNTSGAREGLEFVRERAFIEEQRDREFGGRDFDSSSVAYRSRADYMLTGTVDDMRSGNTNYVFMSVQLVQLREAATGPGRGAADIVWEGFYEVKFAP